MGQICSAPHLIILDNPAPTAAVGGVWTLPAAGITIRRISTTSTIAAVVTITRTL